MIKRSLSTLQNRNSALYTADAPQTYTAVYYSVQKLELGRNQIII